MPRRRAGGAAGARAGQRVIVTVGGAAQQDNTDKKDEDISNDNETMAPIHVNAPMRPPASIIADSKPAERRASQTANTHNTGNNTQSSLNHLLGFSLPARVHPPPRTSRRSGRSAPSWGRSARERYLNAQFKFMLKPTGDYTVHFADPDIYFNWPDVLQVLVPTSSVLPAAAQTIEGPSASSDSLLPSCPICLSEPVAPRMTKCGHIFCYPCVLHYLELSDQTGQKCRSCPICYDTVYARELKSVKWYDPVSEASRSDAQLAAQLPTNPQDASAAAPADTKHNSHDYITMRLIHRTTISTLALPKSSTWPSELIPPHAAPWSFLPDIFTFSRFMLATPDYMAAELRQDMRQLIAEETSLMDLVNAHNGNRDDLGLVFVEAAKRKVGEQIEKVGLLRTELVERASETAWLDLEALRERQARRAANELQRLEKEQSAAESSTSADETAAEQSAPEGYPGTGAAGGAYNPSAQRHHHAPSRTSSSHPATPNSGATNSRNNRQRRNVNPPAPNDATYLFYQASSGQHIYLHPLDIKILKSHFESYSAFPEVIRVRIDGVEEGSMNDDLRKRCRYLSHLPSGCDITFVEGDLSSVIPNSALAPYAQALKKRSAKRKDKARKDDRARVKSEQAEKEREQQSFRSLTEGYSRLSASRPQVHELEDGDFSLFPGLSGDNNQSHPTRVHDQLHPVSSREEDPALSTSPASPPAQVHLQASQRTVWGTRAIAGQARHSNDEEHLDPLVEHAWQDFDSMQDRGGRRQGRKKKVVLNLSGGSVRMGR